DDRERGHLGQEPHLVEELLSGPGAPESRVKRFQSHRVHSTGLLEEAAGLASRNRDPAGPRPNLSRWGGDASGHPLGRPSAFLRREMAVLLGLLLQKHLQRAAFPGSQGLPLGGGRPRRWFGGGRGTRLIPLRFLPSTLCPGGRAFELFR